MRSQKPARSSRLSRRVSARLWPPAPLGTTPVKKKDLTRELGALFRVLPALRPRPTGIPPGGPPGGRKGQQVEAASPKAHTLGSGPPTCRRPLGPRVVQVYCPQGPGAARRLPAAGPRGIGCATESARPGNGARAASRSRSGRASHVRELRYRAALRKAWGSRPCRARGGRRRGRTEEGAESKRTKRGSGRGGAAPIALFCRWSHSWRLRLPARRVLPAEFSGCRKCRSNRGRRGHKGLPSTESFSVAFSLRAGGPRSLDWGGVASKDTCP